jgi:hypothetical protein
MIITRAFFTLLNYCPITNANITGTVKEIKHTLSCIRMPATDCGLRYSNIQEVQYT